MPPKAKSAEPTPAIADSPPLFPQIELPPSLEGVVDEVAWEVIEKMFPVWVRQRVAFVLHSEDPAHLARRQVIYSNLRDAIFANAVAGAGLNGSSNVLPPGGG